MVCCWCCCVADFFCALCCLIPNYNWLRMCWWVVAWDAMHVVGLDESALPHTCVQGNKAKVIEQPGLEKKLSNMNSSDRCHTQVHCWTSQLVHVATPGPRFWPHILSQYFQYIRYVQWYSCSAAAGMQYKGNYLSMLITSLILTIRQN